MFKEILQNNKGLYSSDNQHPTAPGFDWMNSIEVLKDEYKEGYKKHAESFKDIFKGEEYVLELGCGGGNLSYYIRKQFPNIKYITLDINADSPNSKFIQKENHFIVYTDREYKIQEDNQIAQFDYILSFEHIEHIPSKNLPKFFENIRIHSKPNTIVYSTASKIFSPVHHSIFNRDEWRKILYKYGFNLLDSTQLTEENCPPNVDFKNTTELIFQLR